MGKRTLMLHSSSDMYGASKIFFILALTLRENGNFIHVVLSEEGPLAVELREADIKVTIIRLGIIRRKYFNPKGLVNRSYTLKKAYRQLTTIVKEENINHIYSNTSAVLVGSMVSKANKIEHTWHIHEIITKPDWFANILGKFVGKFANKVIVVSQAVKKEWGKYIDNHKIELVYNGLDYDAFFNAEYNLREELGIEKDTVIIGMIGRVNHWKGQSYFLDIANILSKKYKDIFFVMVGDALPDCEYLYKEIEDKILETDLSDKVFNLGFRKDIPEILSELDLFVLPSILPDPLPTVILEAMASGKPVVATSHGGALEMVKDRETGILIPWDNPDVAAENMFELIEKRDLRNTMGEKARERVMEHFSLNAFKEKMAVFFS